MVGLKKIRGALRPLFDRLVDDDPLQPYDEDNFSIMTREEFEASLACEIDHLLNTRMTIPTARQAHLHLGVLGYGVPERFGLSDTTHFDPESPNHRHIISESIQATLLAYEPRLLQPKVTVGPLDPTSHALPVLVEGVAQFGELTIQVSLPFQVESPRR